MKNKENRLHNAELSQDELLALQKKIDKEVEEGINKMETNDFDWIPSKPAVRSTYVTLCKDVEKRINKPIGIAPYNTFDRLKICIDLMLYGSDIEFEIIQMENDETPDKPKSYIEKRMESHRLLKYATTHNPLKELENLTKHNNNNDTKDELDIFDEELDELDIEDEPEVSYRNESHKNTYPNCRIGDYVKELGLNQLYIKNDTLVIDVTGKWVASDGNLGGINIHNIRTCIQKVLDLGVIRFNLAKTVEIATVRLCDVTLDIQTEKKDKFIRALSALYPLYSARNHIRKYSNNGLLIRSKSKNAGMCFNIYDKGAELNDNRRTDNTKYRSLIGNKGEQLADKTLRLEVHLYKLKDMRYMLELAENEQYQVSLLSVLRSKAPVILKTLKRYTITEENLRNDIIAFTEEFLPKTPNPQTVDNLIKLFASERMAELLIEHRYNVLSLSNRIAIEYRLLDTETLLRNLSSFIQQRLYTFLLYRKPKSIKLILDLLNIIHSAYGRGGNNE